MNINKHILIAEDEEAVAAVMKSIAEEEGFKATTAITGNEAFSLVAANRELYSCVILDLNLPGMNGETVINHLKKLGSDTKIIVYSGALDPATYARLNRFEMVVSCHQKPVSLSIIRSLLRNISERGGIKKAAVCR